MTGRAVLGTDGFWLTRLPEFAGLEVGGGNGVTLPPDEKLGALCCWLSAEAGTSVFFASLKLRVPGVGVAGCVR